MTATYNHSAMLMNMNMENIAEFMFMIDEGSSYQWVKSITFVGMHEMLRENANSPIVIWPGMSMPKNTFLGYIANLVRYAIDQRMPYPYMIQSIGVGNPIRLALKSGLSTESIAQLTGWDLEYVREFYKDYIVIA